MKTLRLPEKQDIVNSFDELLQEDIHRFICKFEDLRYIGEFYSKVFTNREKLIPQLHKICCTEIHEEYFSALTGTIYVVSQIGTNMHFWEITFKEYLSLGITHRIDSKHSKITTYCDNCKDVIDFNCDDVHFDRINTDGTLKYECEVV